MKKSWILKINVFAVLLCFLFGFQKSTATVGGLSKLNQAPTFFQKIYEFFLPSFPSTQNEIFIPIVFGENGHPLIQMEIEGSAYLLSIDLGFYAQVSIEQEILEKIKKTPYGLAKFNDFKGNNYVSQKYLIPEIRIGNTIFAEVIAKEESEDFKKNSVLWDRSESTPSKIRGKIGRALLKRKNILLLDFPNSRIAFIENPRLFKALNFLDDVPPIPFEYTHSGIVLTVNTDLGTKKIFLDTGFTINAIRAAQCQNQKCQIDRNGLSYFTSSQFVIGNKNYGETRFYPLDIAIGIDEFDGILGMDFMRRHTFYIDFREKILHIE
jgi:hypothetical protein